MQTQDIKGNLARLLATENLIVEHRKVATASFDVDRRVLTLPNWDKASGIVYDMLVGHEVGHALFTPNEDWRSVADCPKDFVNVIEDARIEKLMKRKYPGLRKSFAGGYKELNDQDFFGIENEDVSQFSLIDRINLHFKVGASAMMPFSIEEQVFVARTDVAETFEEVLQIAVDVFEFSKQEKVEDVPPSAAQQGESESNDDEESEQQQSEPSEAPQPQAATNNAGPIENEDDEEEEVEEMEGLGGGGETSETQSAFDSAAEKLSSSYGRNPIYVEIPEAIDLDSIIVDWTTLHDWIDKNAAEPETYEYVDNQYYEFRKQSQKEVNYLVKEFECRKSADAYARAGQSKTGVLDTAKLHTYQYNEDLFKKVTVLPDGKNHGMIFILDWSGSMGNELFATVKQLLNLTAFCKKVQIPFEVYAFTNEWYVVDRIKNGQPPEMSSEEYFSHIGCKEGEIFLHKNQFHLMNFVSSRSNSKDYERMCLHLYREAYAYTYHVYYHTTIGIGLSGTPLNESIVMLNYLIPEFKKQNDLQKVNVCILSDGEGSQVAYGRRYFSDYKDENYVRPRRIDYTTVLRDRDTGHVYSSGDGWGEMTTTLLKQVRHRNPGVSILGFRIMSGSQLSSFVSSYGSLVHYNDVQRQWKKDKSAIITMPKGYTALYAISNTTINADTDFDVEEGAKKGEISKAFKKMLKNKSTNKKLLNSFISQIA